MISGLMLVAMAPLSKVENAMLSALRDRDIPEVRRLVKSHATILFIIGDKKDATLANHYWLATSRIYARNSKEVNASTDIDIRTQLDRLSRSISFSQSKPSLQPFKVRSQHNDLTKHTIRGKLAPEVYWEIHYDVLKTGQINIQRICEFDHATKFIW
ncbi:MAG TPA: hypothetical protein VK171_08540 [Fimbriimonas sp.]|nr:hypothetical protein [Fimbriimonas sp.]